jgi:hypothetical protein
VTRVDCLTRESARDRSRSNEPDAHIFSILLDSRPFSGNIFADGTLTLPVTKQTLDMLLQEMIGPSKRITWRPEPRRTGWALPTAARFPSSKSK